MEVPRIRESLVGLAVLRTGTVHGPMQRRHAWLANRSAMPRWQGISRHMRWTAACSPRHHPIPATSGVSREEAGVHHQPVGKRTFSVACPLLALQFASVTHGSDLAVPVDRPIPGIVDVSGQARQPPNWRFTKTSSASSGAAARFRRRNGGCPGPSRCRRRDLNPRPTHYECVALPSELRRR